MEIWESLLQHYGFVNGTALEIFIARAFAWLITIKGLYNTMKSSLAHLECLSFNAAMKSSGEMMSISDMYWLYFPEFTLEIFCGYCIIMFKSFFPIILYIIIKFTYKHIACLILDIQLKVFLFKARLRKKQQNSL